MSVVTQIILELRQTTQGAKVLNDWLGEGGFPVSQSQAEARAFICKTCPLNVHPNWWNKFFKNPIAKAMRQHLVVKNHIGLQVTGEDALHVCRPCGCALPLKVFVPIKHIQAHHKPEHTYDPRCWIPSEMEANQ